MRPMEGSGWITPAVPGWRGSLPAARSRGIHGADRLGAWPQEAAWYSALWQPGLPAVMLERITFPLSQWMISAASCTPPTNAALPTIKQPLSDTGRIPDSPQEICRRVKELMWRYGGIIRTEKDWSQPLRPWMPWDWFWIRIWGLMTAKILPSLRHS